MGTAGPDAADEVPQGHGAPEDLKDRAAELLHDAREAVRSAADATADAADTVRATAQGLVDDHGPALTGVVGSAGAALHDRGGPGAALADRVEDLARRAVESLGSGPADPPAAAEDLPDRARPGPAAGPGPSDGPGGG
jgi:hypothetical protein